MGRNVLDEIVSNEKNGIRRGVRLKLDSFMTPRQPKAFDTFFALINEACVGILQLSCGRPPILFNLQRLLAEMQCRESQGASPKQVQQVAAAIPLSHAVTTKSFAGICQSRQLLSQRRLIELGLRANESTVEQYLGTDEAVFFFVAPFCYPSTNCGFLFKASMEQTFEFTGDATPFDSGGLMGHFEHPTIKEPKPFWPLAGFPWSNIAYFWPKRCCDRSKNPMIILRAGAPIDLVPCL